MFFSSVDSGEELFRKSKNLLCYEINFAKEEKKNIKDSLKGFLDNRNAISKIQKHVQEFLTNSKLRMHGNDENEKDMYSLDYEIKKLDAKNKQLIDVVEENKVKENYDNTLKIVQKNISSLKELYNKNKTLVSARLKELGIYECAFASAGAGGFVLKWGIKIDLSKDQPIIENNKIVEEYNDLVKRAEKICQQLSSDEEKIKEELKKKHYCRKRII